MRVRVLLILPLVLTAFSLHALGTDEHIPPRARNARVFAIVHPIIHPFFQEVSTGAEEEAAALGATALIMGPERFDVHRQIEIVEELIRMKVDGIAIGPTDPRALTPVINKAIESGIMVIALADDAPESKRISFIGTDDYTAGRHMAEVLARLVGYKGGVIVSMGVPTQYVLNVRLKGVRDVLRKYPDIHIIDLRSGEGDPDKTLSNIEKMVEAHPNFDALIGIDAAAGPAAVIVWKAKGLKKPVITFDDMPENVQGIKDGKITMALVQKQYLWGRLAIKRLNALCDGKKIPKLEYTGIIDVTRENVGTYKETYEYKSEGTYR
jgi:ribose transport system substrate-binding protein